MKDFFSQDGIKSDVLIGAIAIFGLVLASDFVTAFMPSTLVMMAIGVFVAAFGLFAVLIWREQPRDEREEQQIMASDRLGFLAGAIVLSLGLVIQTLRHEPTTVLTIALVVMIVVKLVGKYVHK